MDVQAIQSGFNFKDWCKNPRSDYRYDDRQGLKLDEKNWLRSWTNDVYLWYNEVTDENPADFGEPIEYFSQLKTFETTVSGKRKDEFHFTQDTKSYLQESQSGILAGYGMTISMVSKQIPRVLLIAYTQPNSPATQANTRLKRGTKILEVDGISAVYGNSDSDIDIINAGLFPQSKGETHRFIVQDYGSSQSREVIMTSAEISLQTVQNQTIINTASGKIGYMVFNEFIAVAEQQLIDAVTYFKDQQIDDLIIDLRYNGGGRVYVATELASMIADPDLSRNQIFVKAKFNDKHPIYDPFTGQLNRGDRFVTSTLSNAPRQSLPNLGLSRVYILTGGGTCSASELIINGLRGVNLEVVQIGSTTCGKPYSFYPTDNCGTSYFSINASSTNANGFGDYSDGFTPVNSPFSAGVRLPGCSVGDDFATSLGDPAERRLSAALNYRETGVCPTVSGRPDKNMRERKDEILKPLWLKNAIY